MSIARLSIAVAAALGSSTASAAGSVVFDNTLPGQAHGTTTTVPLSAGHYTIDASNTGYLSNTNLFESFATFIVGAAEEADFTNSTHLQIDNVISRVTGIGAPNGLQPTTIDGKVVSTIAGANFWFVNPAGVAIGSGASINVPAGLAIGTSDFIQFADSSRWYVLESAAPTPSVLSTASPAAFGFLSTPAAGALTVRSAQLSSATGGNLLLSGGAAGVTVSNSQLTTSNAMGGAAAGDIDVTSAGQLTILNSTLSSETFTAANAGSINLTSNGPMSIQNGNLISQTNTTAAAGNINLTANLPAGADPAAGAITIIGGLISSRPDPNAPYLAGSNGGPGNVSISGPALLVSGGSIESTSNGNAPAGTVTLAASAATGVGPSNGGTGDAILITNATRISSSDGIHADQSAGGIAIQASTGSIRIDSGSHLDANTTQGGPLSVNGATGITLDAASISAETSFNGNSSTPAQISLQSQGPITIANGTAVTSTTGGSEASDNIVMQTSAALMISGGSSLTSADSGSGQGPAGNISLTAAAMHVAGGQISSSGNAGVVSLTATGTDGSDAPALLVDGGAQIESSLAAGLGFNSDGASGNIQLRAAAGTVTVSGVPGTPSGATTLSSSGVGPSASAGSVSLTGMNVSLQGALIETTTGAESGVRPGLVTVNATGNAVLDNTLINTESSGFGTPAGSISITGAGSVSINGGQGLPGSAPTNIALYSGSTNRGDAGAISVSSANGLVTILNATLDTQSFFLANSGSIAVSGAGVLVGKQSLLSADYADPGSSDNSGPGTISIRATAAVGASDPLQGQLSSATPGVVRIVDSGVTAINSGGAAGNTAGRGQILIGADLPGGSPDITSDVVIAGSFVSTDVSAGGRGNDLTIIGSDAVWIGPSPTGGYLGRDPSTVASDPRFATSPNLQITGYGRSLISARTESSAVSGGQILIKGGAGGVSIVSSNVDASNSVDGSNAGATRSPSNITVDSGSSGPVLLSDTVMTTETSGVNKAGNVVISGGSVAMAGGELSAASTAADPSLPDVGDAGSVSITSSQATGVGAAASVTINGTVIRSDATQAAALVDSAGDPTFAIGSGTKLAIPNAGTVTLSAAQGSIEIGGNSIISTAAGPRAGNAGVVSITASNGGVNITSSTVTTNVASTWTVDSSGKPVPPGVATIAIGSGAALKVANSQLDAATSGVQQAGEIDLQGAPIQISDSMISSATTGTGAAGAICASANCVGVSGSAGVGGRGGARQVSASASSVAGAGISISGSTLSTATSTSGPAGDITVITPGALVLSGTTIDSQSTSTAADAGPVGVINLSSGSVSLSGSTVSAISKGGTAVASEGGPAGAAITISSTGDSSPFTISGSTITTQATVTNGSNIVVNVGGSELLLSNSQVSASAAGGNGGNITVTDAGNTVLQGSQIVAQAGPGNGGAINIGLKQGAVFVRDSGSVVSATSRTGNNGTVTINSPQTDLNSALRVPEVSVAHAPELTANVCRPGNNRSTFVREGRGGVAPDPQGYLSGPVQSTTPAAWNIEDSPPAAALTTPPLLFATITTTTECP